MASIKNLQKNWEGFAKKDPLWAICTYPDKIKNKWNLEDFFLTGKKEIDTVWKYLKFIRQPVNTKTALDFGCGVGRLTQALSKHFDSCYGVDISATMIKLAKKFNKFSKKCHYIVNETNNLSVFQDNYFSFIYSSIVFQHIPPKHTEKYLKEFVRVLKPGGLIVFQIPESFKGKRAFTLNLKTLIGKLLVALGIGYKMEMHYITEKNVRNLVAPAGVIDVKFVNFGENFRYLKSEPKEGHVIKQYCVKKV